MRGAALSFLCYNTRIIEPDPNIHDISIYSKMWKSMKGNTLTEFMDDILGGERGDAWKRLDGNERMKSFWSSPRVSGQVLCEEMPKSVEAYLAQGF